MKRLFDIFASVSLLIILFPLLIVISFLNLYFHGWPIVFIQVRPGYQQKLFKMYKFRTMNNTLGINGELLSDKLRLTRFGKFLRATSLDELPELWNVIMGDMSLVGPRPLLVEYLELYSLEQARRHDVKPGITGWAQVNGRNAISWEEKFELDLWYIDNWTFLLDVKVLCYTVMKVLLSKGIVSKGHVTAPKFKGQ